MSFLIHPCLTLPIYRIMTSYNNSVEFFDTLSRLFDILDYFQHSSTHFDTETMKLYKRDESIIILSMHIKTLNFFLI